LWIAVSGKVEADNASDVDGPAKAAKTSPKIAKISKRVGRVSDDSAAK
jgi:hypothetical protein